MIQLRFKRGSAFIDVIIDGRKLKFVTPLLNLVPIEINLDKLDEQKQRIKKMNMDKKVLKELSLLETEEQMRDDLVNDLRKSGWEVQEIGNR